MIIIICEWFGYGVEKESVRRVNNARGGLESFISR